MTTVQSIKKHKDDLLITFEDQTTLVVAYDIVTKYHLAPSLSLDDKTFKEMQQDNAFLFFKRLALKRLAKMMTAYELYLYLIEKGATKAIANQIIHEFKKKKYIDDSNYAKLYIASKQFVEGPKLITDKLKQKGIDHEIIRDQVRLINEESCIKSSISKQFKAKITKNKRQFTMKLKRYYLQRGFNLNAVNTVVDKVVSKLKIDDQSLLEKDLEKLISKSKEPIDKQKMMEKLYRKGYQFEDVKRAVGSMKK